MCIHSTLWALHCRWHFCPTLSNRLLLSFQTHSSFPWIPTVLPTYSAHSIPALRSPRLWNRTLRPRRCQVCLTSPGPSQNLQSMFHRDTWIWSLFTNQIQALHVLPEPPQPRPDQTRFHPQSSLHAAATLASLLASRQCTTQCLSLWYLIQTWIALYFDHICFHPRSSLGPPPCALPPPKQSPFCFSVKCIGR